MPRRIKQKPSLLAPAENLVRRLSQSDARLRRKVLRWSLWVAAVWFGYTIMFGTYSIPRIIRLELQKSSLVEVNQKLRVDLVDASRMRSLLESDPAYLESLARSRYFMVRPNEKIYRFRGR